LQIDQINNLLHYHVKKKVLKSVGQICSKFSSLLSIFLIFTLRLNDLERIKPTQKNGRKQKEESAAMHREK